MSQNLKMSKKSESKSKSKSRRSALITLVLFVLWVNLLTKLNLKLYSDDKLNWPFYFGGFSNMLLSVCVILKPSLSCLFFLSPCPLHYLPMSASFISLYLYFWPLLSLTQDQSTSNNIDKDLPRSTNINYYQPR